MAIPPQIARFLEEGGVEYEALHHPVAYTSQEQAAAAHVSGYEWAKTVVLITDRGEPIMAVLPAPHRIVTERLRELVGARELRLADEADLIELYPDCEPGAMPPLGPLFEQRVFIDRRLARHDFIVFDGGTHEDAVRMRYADFERLVRPTLGEFTRLPGAPE